MSDETKRFLTELWREAGRPLADGMQMQNGDMVNSAEGVEFLTPSGCIESGLLSSHVPDWDHPMTDFAMMCAAEQAAGEAIAWVASDIAYDGDGWIARSKYGDATLGGRQRFYPSRIECALAVIRACREVSE